MNQDAINALDAATKDLGLTGSGKRVIRWLEGRDKDVIFGVATIAKARGAHPGAPPKAPDN